MLYEEVYGAQAWVRDCLLGEQMVFAIPDDVWRRGRWLGGECPADALAYTRSGVELDLLIPAKSSPCIAVLPVDRFAVRFEALTGQPAARVFPMHGIFLKLHGGELQWLREKWQRIIAGGRVGASRTLEERITETLAATCLSFIETGGGTPNAACRNFRRALERLEAPGPVPTIAELALDLGISQRAVELAFRGTVRMPPVQFLNRLRLPRVRRRLSICVWEETTVSGEAVEQGFHELGRFVGEYRGFFGELPSETLRRQRRSVPESLPGIAAGMS